MDLSLFDKVLKVLERDKITRPKTLSGLDVAKRVNKAHGGDCSEQLIVLSKSMSAMKYCEFLGGNPNPLANFLWSLPPEF